ncbi:MAG: adenine deaminase [Blautia sp.]
MELNQYRSCAQAARGLKEADLVLKNGNVVNVFTKEVYPADIAIVDGVIVGVGTYIGKQELDFSGRYICPGFIDSHLHLESTLVTPKELIHQAAQCGTTTFIVDPHESANVAGLSGIDYILEQTKQVPANVYVMMPSCVPSTAVDDNGCCLTADMMAPYLENPRILGLGEVMDHISVIEGEEQMHQKLELFAHKIRDGHAPGLNGADLSAYALAGIATDHECTDYEYAMEERRRGMTILIREGSAAKNLEAIVTGLVRDHMDTSGFCFCTDDKHIEEIRKDGHINFNVKKAVSLGMEVKEAICMATIHAAKCYGLQHLGAIAPGYQADLVILDSLEELNVLEVFHKGIPVEKDAKITVLPCAEHLKNTVHLNSFFKDQLKLKRTDGKMHVIQMLDGQILTEDLLEEVPGGEYFEADQTYKKIAVIERHKGTGKVGVGIVKGFGIQGGAIASSVSHDSHNIIVVGDNDEDMETAVRELIRVQGGYTVVEGGAVFETLALPIMGLISDAGYETVNETLSRMIEKANQMGVSENMEPFITLSFMALPVIPKLRILPRGLYCVQDQTFIQ